MARVDVLAARPELGEALAHLNGQIKTHQMRQLVSDVLLNGWAPGGVARRFPREHHLLAREIDPLGRRPVIDVALNETERAVDRHVLVLALRAVRHACPHYLVRLQLVDDPVKAVAQGRARLALVGSHQFFWDEDDNHFSRKETRIEAAAVRGTPYLHILRRREEEPLQSSFAGRVGVVAKETGEARVAAAIVEAAGRNPDVYEPAEILLEKVAEGEINVALLFRMPGDAWGAKQMVERG